MDQRIEGIKQALRLLSETPDLLPVEPDDSPRPWLRRSSLRALFGLLLESNILAVPDQLPASEEVTSR